MNRGEWVPLHIPFARIWEPSQVEVKREQHLPTHIQEARTSGEIQENGTSGENHEERPSDDRASGDVQDDRTPGDVQENRIQEEEMPPMHSSVIIVSIVQILEHWRHFIIIFCISFWLWK